VTTIIEIFADSKSLQRSAEYAGEMCAVSVAIGASVEAGERARLAAHYGELYLDRAYSECGVAK
jgi:hypothetical protein